MSKVGFVRRCVGCGEELQSEDPQKPGYLSKEVLLSVPLSTPLFCEKCAEAERSNLAPRLPSPSADFLSMLLDAKASDALIVYVIDLFSFEASFIPEVMEIISGLKILVLANKRDLLPKSCKEEDLREYVAHRFRCEKVGLKKEDVALVSLRSALDMAPLAKRIDDLRQGHDVYVIGAVGAGKTLFVSEFLRSYVNASRRAIQTTNYPKTNLRVMMIPLDASSCLYDAPGLSIENSVVHLLDPTAAKSVVPIDRVKARSFTLEEGNALFLGGLGRIELSHGGTTSLKAYFSEEVDLVKSRAANQREAFRKALQKGSLSPSSRWLATPADFDAFDLEVFETGRRDLGIEGLGWISFEGAGQVFRIYVPKGAAVYSSRAKVK